MKKILSKILEEVNKETPRLDYIRGLIEASIEEEEKPERILSRDEIAAKMLESGFTTTYTTNQPGIIKSDEQEEIPAYLRPGPIAPLSS